MTRHRTTTVAGAVVLGLVLVALVAALLVAAVSSREANHTADTAVSQLREANQQLDALRADIADQAKRSRKAAAERNRLLAQNRALARLLREHGFTVPPDLDIPTPPATRSGSASDSSGDRPRSSRPEPTKPHGPKSSPTPAQPTPAAPSTPSTPEPSCAVSVLTLCVPLP